MTGTKPTKVFNEMTNVGSSKYVVNHHDGVKTHPDGSPFFEIVVFSNKRKKEQFVNELRAAGYVEQA